MLAAKRDARREVVPESAGNDSLAGWEPSDPAPSPAESLVFEETLAQVLAGLSARERTIVQLRLQGHTIPEVAEKAAASERSIHRILAGVRTRLETLAAE